MVRQLFFFLLAVIALAATPAFANPKETVLYNFGSSPDGSHPVGVISDGLGNLYGATLSGGQFGWGTVFVIAADGTKTTLHDFASGSSDGGQPSNLSMDSKGNLYGSTGFGGTNNSGVLFELKHKNGRWQEVILYNFCVVTNCADGANPADPVTIGPKGSLFGTTTVGGAQSKGAVFRLDKHGATWLETVIYSFCSQTNCADGYSPQKARLLLTKSGTIFGTAASGPNQQGGTLYALGLNGSNFQVLHSFPGDSSDGWDPDAGVISDSNGVLYGGTVHGGANEHGIVYSYDPSSSIYQQIYVAPDTTEPAFIGNEMIAVGGKKGVTLYGASLGGGANGGGSIFSLTPPKTSGTFWNVKSLYDFCAKASCGDGALPSDLIDVDGVFYGTAVQGSTSGGLVFRFGE